MKTREQITESIDFLKTKLDIVNDKIETIETFLELDLNWMEKRHGERLLAEHKTYQEQLIVAIKALESAMV